MSTTVIVELQEAIPPPESMIYTVTVLIPKSSHSKHISVTIASGAKLSWKSVSHGGIALPTKLATSTQAPSVSKIPSLSKSHGCNEAFISTHRIDGAIFGIIVTGNDVVVDLPHAFAKETVIT